ncbi:FimV/HubP family polar landmark protein [Massilia atriviolacea]|uniref:FimV/HubP family polar landmark protein n=1 Tax=Massilia atriviolacea TaxID=2495579 RepID=UPI0027D97D57|nr:FimV/HubP family polar landmark protein [Massilia atriviolacea]
MKTLTGAVASAVLLSTSAYAAGLGKLTVLSALGQPLNAEIELTSVANDEASGLVAKLAPVEAFRQANIDFNPALLSLRFNVEQRGGRQIIKVTSSQPVNEPFVDMLLELNWGSSGRLVREYTFLLDPVEMRSTQAAQVSAPVDVLSQGARNGAAAKPNARAERAAARAAAAAAKAEKAAQKTETAAEPASQEPQRAGGAAGKNAGDSEYQVKRGDTLGKIAAQVKPADISLDMMLVALYRANPDAFAGNNMNRLKSGQILSVPDSGAIKGSDGEARGVVVAHAADFNAYRSKLAGQVAGAAPDKEPEKTQSAAGKITAKVAERPTAVNESKDQLKLSKATSPADAAAAGKTGVLSPEDKIAKERAMAEATKRVKELEKNVGDLEKIVTVKSKTGAAATAPATTPATPAAKTPITEVVSAKPPVTPPAAVTPPPAATPATPPAATTAATAPAPVPVIETAPPAPEAAPVPPVAKPAAKPVVAAPPPEPSFFDMLMENIVLVGAAIVALLAGLFGLSKWRERKQVASNPSEPSILGAPTDQAHSLFAETGGQSVDTNNSVFNSSFAPSASQLDTNEVDPVAEADVYIAYGRDAQAEEILKEALRTHPDRYPVRLKLLEIYAARKDQRAFESQASELYGLTKGQGDEWAQAAALGLSIDAMNPLYASAGSSPATAAADQPVALADQFDASAIDNGPHSALMDLDLDLGNSATATPAAPVVAAAPAAPAKEEEHTLDFDLGGLSFDPVTNNEPAPAPAAQAMDEHHLSFDTPAVTPARVDLVKDETPDMDFDMDFNAPSTAAPAAASVSLDKPASDDFNLDGMNFDLPQSTSATPSLANDDPFAADKTAKAEATPDFDMHALDLDLPASASTEATALPDFGDIGSDAPAGELTPVQMEMETKLDLAIAYQEIGDKEGARELLDEVIKGGSAAQVAKANDMRIKLA